MGTTGARKNLLWLAFILAAAFAFRLWLSIQSMHTDLIITAGWGQWISSHGPKGFYENSVWVYGWPTQPMVANLLYGWSFSFYERLNTLFVNISSFIAYHRLVPTKFWWWFNFVRWFGSAHYGATSFQYGELILMKVPTILADLGIALFIFFLGKGVVGQKKSLLLTTIYLFSPFSWYGSGVWGQTDQLAFLVVLVALVLTPAGLSLFSPLVIMVAILIKPTALIFIPLWLWVVAKRDIKRLAAVALGSLAALALYYWLVRMFSDLPLTIFDDNLKRIVFVKGAPVTWVSAFNFWRLVTHRGWLSSDFLLGIPFKLWADLIYGLFYLAALWRCRKRNLRGILEAIFIVGFAGWMFLMTMHERYFFPAVAAGLMLVIYEKRLLKYWLVLSVVFFLNLYYGYPPQWGFLRQILSWQGDLVPRILSAINLILLLRMMAVTGVGKELRELADWLRIRRTPRSLQ